ncbi:hypothetical protein [Arcticibacter eurypsychrophilus]|uniref:hypothetical protein n=1 Tax=Arcticibacter eurypsychrophilus TaxID=1434752 RepID=UPI00084D30B2|nr:hypothetical protein [Arcticibacter eurypsychrophilus]
MASFIRFFLNFWKWILIIILVLFLILGGIAWYLSNKWKPLLDAQIKQLVLDSSDSLYRVEYSGLKINLLTGNASLKNLKLIPDTARYKELERLKRAPDNLYNLQVESFDLVRFHPSRLYDSKKLNINSIIIDQPKMIITNKRQPYNKVADTVKKKTLYQMISKALKEVRVDEIQLKEIDFTFINNSNKKSKTTAIKNLNLNVNDLLIDSLSENDKNRFYHTKNVDIELKDYKIATPDSLYFLKFKTLKFSTLQRKLVLNGAQMQPRYTIPVFYRRVGKSKDRFDISFNQIVVTNIDLDQLNREQRFYAGRLILADGKVSIYNTNAFPKRPSNKTGKFPHQQLQKLALDLKIDTLQLRRINISYNEYNRVTRRTGVVNFANTRGSIYNVTNDAKALAKNKFMRARLSTLFMSKANLYVTFDFNLTDKAGAFSSTGTLGAMNGTSLNRITDPLAMVHIRSLNIRKMQFNMTANQNAARGSVRFYYTNLNIELMKKDAETGEVKKQGLVSGIANRFVLNESNPVKKDNKFTVGSIYFKRPASFAFFKFYVKSLLEGVKGSVGISKEREQNIKKISRRVSGIINDVKFSIEALKERRKENKIERQEKRKLKRAEKELEKAKDQEKKEPDVAPKDSLQSGTQ